MIFKYIAIESACPSCKNKNIEKYCENLIGIIDDFEKAQGIFIQADEKLNNLAKRYKQKFRNSYIDNIDHDKLCRQQEFTDFILLQMNIKNKNISKERQRNIDNRQESLPLFN
ncbi:MAG: hypothetical protein J7647_24025 [Cyanobacteria bacterium SBLK]|nr:hypothetical protein [Cyanobacteria bacterium SBLK]